MPYLWGSIFPYQIPGYPIGYQGSRNGRVYRGADSFGGGGRRATQDNLGGKEMIVVNTNEVPRRKIAKTLGLVMGHTVRAVWVGKDVSAILRVIAGGELKEYTEVMGKARKEALDRMVKEAEKLGADAIINVRFTSLAILAGSAEMLVYGTAVKLV